MCSHRWSAAVSKVDIPGLREYGDELLEAQKNAESEIYTLAGGEFNIASPKQLGTVLFEKLGLPALKKTKSGYSTSADVLEKAAPVQPDNRSYIRLPKSGKAALHLCRRACKCSRHGRYHPLELQAERNRYRTALLGRAESAKHSDKNRARQTLPPLLHPTPGKQRTDRRRLFADRAAHTRAYVG